MTNTVTYAGTDWNKLIMPKHRYIYWQVVNSQLLTRDNLSQFMTLSSTLCPIFECKNENHSHLFMNCIFGKMVFNEISIMVVSLSWEIKNLIKSRVLGLGIHKLSKENVYMKSVIESW
ncbi:hypothetical protein G4B88_009577 [Cannabis sativa]|uniref:Reverse transcriptase zinc-binding domain-containing protein n=1 Tax=Cannabis sativa TaxID=3483 RepID=A0A7J6GGP1_CANSA|nr:hypothetical protein G4B88_009577 [Cannabis sativa]